MPEILLDPLFLFFAVGFGAGILKSDVKLPQSVYHLISTYLLLAIGLKGGVQLAGARFSEILLPVLGTLMLGVITPFLAFAVGRYIGRLNRADSAGLAAHYGSVSAVTYAAAVALLLHKGRNPEGFMPVLLILLEIPAILIGVLLFRIGPKDANEASKLGHEQAPIKEVMLEVVLNRSVFLLAAGLLVGFLTGKERFQPYELLFVSAFKPILAFFVMEMGLLAASKIGDVKKAGPFLLGFGVGFPLISGFAGAWVGTICGLSPDGAFVLATMSASASYIAAPAAMRMAVPEANTGMCVAVSLGVTFPFNLAIGLIVYEKFVTWLQ